MNDQRVVSPVLIWRRFRKGERKLKRSWSIMNRVERLWAFDFPVYTKTYQGKSIIMYNFEPTRSMEELKAKIQSQEGLPLGI